MRIESRLSNFLLYIYIHIQLWLLMQKFPFSHAMYSAIKQITSLKYKYKYKDLKYIDLFTVYSLQFFLTISVAIFIKVISQLQRKEECCYLVSKACIITLPISFIFQSNKREKKYTKLYTQSPDIVTVFLYSEIIHSRNIVKIK